MRGGDGGKKKCGGGILLWKESESGSVMGVVGSERGGIIRWIVLKIMEQLASDKCSGFLGPSVCVCVH